MKVVASPEVVAFVGERGGRLFVWAVPMDTPTGPVFALEASTESPGAEREFRRLGGEEFDLLLDVGDRPLPDELHLAVRGWRRKAIRAYWNGHSFGRG
ncbi:MAG: hypothetical protein L0206_17525 [Actinobacteria bacterium]|nr:hypothetical protein [Actinomycetota bacterium]